jgi:hypothetical protein
MNEMKNKAYYIVIGSVFGLFGRVLYDIIPMTILRLLDPPLITNEEFAMVIIKGSVGIVMGCVLFLLANVIFKKRNSIDSDT